MQQVRNELGVGDRPLTARSIVASLLLGMRDPRLTGSRLVRAAQLFGLSEGTTRVALSRMVAAGELVVADGCYRLAGPLAWRHGRQEEGRHPPGGGWDGTWRLAVLGSLGGRRAASERAGARRELLAARMAEWREGVWVRPDNLAGQHGLGRGAADIDGCTWWVGARPIAPGDAPGVAASLWDLDGWASTAAELRAAMAATPPAATPPAATPPAATPPAATSPAATSPAGGIPSSFRVAAAVVRHLRDDPLLPVELLPADWPGDSLREEYDAYESSFQAALRPVLLG